MSPTAILTAFVHNFDKPFCRSQVVKSSNCSVADFGINFHREDLVSLFRRQVFTRPASVALKDDQFTLTYSELDVWSSLFCEAITSHLGHYESESIIAVCFPRSALLLVSVLAIAKAGLAYVALDPNQTVPYIQKQLEQSSALLLLTTSCLSHIHAAVAPNKIFIAETLLPHAREKCRSAIHVIPSGIGSSLSNSLLTVLFTSGTTGKPKGVMIDHRAMINAINGNLSALQPGERVAITANPAFDAWSLFVWEVICKGAVAIMYTSHLADLHTFAEFVKNERIDKAFLPTAAFARLVEEPGLVVSLSRTLRRLIVAGERLAPEVVRQFSCVGTRIELINAYGPSETAVLTTFHKVDLTTDIVESQEIPIGQPISNLRVHILDSDLLPLPPREIGEICISGPSLARGYLNQEHLTKQNFPYITDSRGLVTRVYRTGDFGYLTPLIDGSFLLHYKGRRDNQMKLRGQRIEPSQIESVLLRQQIPGIVFGGQAAVVSTDTDQLIAYVVGKPRESSAGQDAELIREAWNTFGNDAENYADVGSSLVGVDFANWNSMYDNAPIPRDHMLDWLEDTVRSIPVEPSDSVLEVGCGTGMLLFHVATQCQDYTGIDISQPSIDFIRSQLPSRGLADSVNVFHGEASQLPEILPTEKRFSLVIMNSVVQYFGSRTYLEDIVNICLSQVDDGGRIFFGDVRSFSLLPHHDLASTVHCGLKNSATTTQISQELARLSDSQSELLVNPSFFLSLAKTSNGRIKHVEIIPKEMETLNELSQFRYQVILHVGQLPFTPLRPSVWSTYSSPEDLEELLSSGETVAIHGIPNKAVVVLQEALKLLRSDHPSPTLSALMEAATTNLANVHALLPSDLRRIAHRHGHQVDISWGSQSLDCTFSAVFTKEAGGFNFKADFGTSVVDSDSELTNVPKIRQVHTISPKDVGLKLREACRSELPSYMVPSHVILLDELPHTSNGKVDLKKLSSPDMWQPYLVFDGISKDKDGDILSARTETEKLIAEMLSEVLAMQPNAIPIDADLFSLGLHSFSAAKLVSRLCDKFKIPKFPIKVIYDSPTVIDLATVIDGHDGETTSSLLSYSEDFEKICKALPTSFPPRRQLKAKRTYFLTGATGFTGLFILRDLMLRREYDVAKVICLVRGSSVVACTQRLFASAAEYGIDTSSWIVEGSESNLEVLQGDLGLDHFGLDDSIWKRMTDEIDIFLANGALVNLALDYSSIRAPNVGGCLTAIRMCTTKHLKALTFVSSMGVYNTAVYKARSAAGLPILEDDDLEDARTGLTIGYLQSKWVSEKIIMWMANLGMPCNIVRPCHISGDSTTGAVSNDDYFWRYTLGFMEMGLFPNKNTALQWVTVNYTAAVCIAAAVAAATGSSQEFSEVVYNVVPSSSMSWTEYLQVLQYYGYDLKLVPIDTFCKHLSSNEVELSQDVLQFRDYYHADMSEDDPPPKCDGRNAQFLLTRHHPWERDIMPLQRSLDDETIGRCIAYMVAIGFMPPPSVYEPSRSDENKRKLPSICVAPRNGSTVPRRSVILR